MSQNDGGPAFGHGAENGHCCGATLRDFFASAALQGMTVGFSRDVLDVRYTVDAPTGIRQDLSENLLATVKPLGKYDRERVSHHIG